jgi:D-threo-aldose 1-dehydrogenase
MTQVPETTIHPGGIATTRLGFGLSRLHYLNARDRQKLLAAAYDRGIRHFDVAPLYGHGLAERELGLFLKGRRDRCVVVTKFGLPASPWIDRSIVPSRALIALRSIGAHAGLLRTSRPPLTAKGLRGAIELSLRRLQIDAIDVHLLHEPTRARIPNLPDLIEAYTKLRDRGLVRSFGVAGSFQSCRDVVADASAPLIMQTHEHEWSGLQPAITFGALSPGPQAVGTPPVDKRTAFRHLVAALQRRPNGVVLVSTRNQKHLVELVEEAFAENRAGRELAE